MKRFLIKYRFAGESKENWHQHIAQFIAAVESDPLLKGKISYRCMKSREGQDYYHLAGTADDEAARMLQSRDFFKRYSEETKRVGGGTMEVVPLEVIGETQA